MLSLPDRSQLNSLFFAKLSLSCCSRKLLSNGSRVSGWLHISAHDVYDAQREEKLSLVLVINMEYFGLHEIQYQPFEDTKVVGDYNFYLSGRLEKTRTA